MQTFRIQLEERKLLKPRYENVQVGTDHEKAQSERNSHSKNRGGET